MILTVKHTSQLTWTVTQVEQLLQSAVQPVISCDMYTKTILRGIGNGK
jgi:hypothetical protein